MWSTIKKILSKEQGSCIVIESDKSIYLVKRLARRKNKPESQTAGPDSLETEKMDRVNRDIAWLKSEEGEKETVAINEDDEVKVEDLPL